MKFMTQIQGIDCWCQVLNYKPYVPATREAPAMESEFDYKLVDRDGFRDETLECMATDEDANRLQDEYEAWTTALKHGIDY